MNLGFTVVSKRERQRDRDAEAVARVESMRPEQRGEQRRNPGTDQKRERRRLQRKTAHSSISADEMMFVEAVTDADESQYSNERRNQTETGPFCPDCNGTGQVPSLSPFDDPDNSGLQHCPTCGGSGIDPGTGMTGGDPRLARRTAEIDFDQSQGRGYVVNTGGEQVFGCPYCDHSGTAAEMEQHLTEAGPQHQQQGTITDQLNARIPGGGGTQPLASAHGFVTLAMEKTAARSCDSCGSDEHVTSDRTLGKDLCNGCKRALQGRRGRSAESSLTVTAFTVKHAFQQGTDGLCVTCGRPDQGIHPRTAVNTGADGAARYQRTPDPKRPDWVTDETDESAVDQDGSRADDTGNGAYPNWEKRDGGKLLDDMEERRRAIVDADEGLLSPGWDEKVTKASTKGSPMTSEADLLTVMADTKRPMGERQAAAAEVEALRLRRSASVRAERETDLAASITEAHLTPTLGGQSLHTTATDWIADAETDEFDPGAEQTVRAEAAHWFAGLHEAVVEDEEEFSEQALGMARRTAGRYGEAAEQAARAFLDHAGRLRTQADRFPTDPEWKDRFNTDKTGVPEEAKDPQRPGATNEQGVGTPADNSPAFDAERPPGDHAHHPKGEGEKVGQRTADNHGTEPPEVQGATQPEDDATKEASLDGLVAYLPAFAQVEARTGVQVPREARPFVAALAAIRTQSDVVGGVEARDVVAYAVRLTEGWAGQTGENLRKHLTRAFASLPVRQGAATPLAHKTSAFPTCAAGCMKTVSADDDLVNISPAMEPEVQTEYGLVPGLAHRACLEAAKARVAQRRTAGDQPPWLNGDDDKGDDDKDDKGSDDDDSKSKDDDEDDDSKSDDDEKKDDEDEDDDTKEASLLGSPVTAAFRSRVQAAVARA